MLLIADERFTKDMRKEIKRQKEKAIELAKTNNIKIEFSGNRLLNFEDECSQIRENVRVEMKGTWNDAYDFVNSINPQPIKKI